ncbi:hypothetical protein V8V48_05380 [Staphylococcus xylosus]|uniref:hypothetical protein n=1 Tax=Staphylococcus xylosus TaxID=1288 RepID=UPI0032035F1B
MNEVTSLIKETVKEFNNNKKGKLIRNYLKHTQNNEVKSVQEKENIDEIISDKIKKDPKNIKKAFIEVLFEQLYKYSAIFKINNSDYEEYIEPLKNKNYDNENIEYVYNEDMQSILIMEEKMGHKLVGDSLTDVKRINASLITIINFENSVYLVISTESIPQYYRRNESTQYYLNKIDSIREFIENTLFLSLSAIDFNYTIEQIRKQDDENEMIVSAQSMNINSGAKATLDSSSSKDIILPILGEIKNLLEENVELFQQCNEGYDLLKNYVEELEQESDLPWVTLRFNNKIQVKFLFETATNKDYTLLNYYSDYNSSKKGREAMNDVTNKIISKYNTFSSNFSEN